MRRAPAGARRLPGNFGPLREKQLLTSVCAAVIIVKLSDAYEPLAQLAEQLPFKQWVRGSNPRRLTIPETALLGQKWLNSAVFSLPWSVTVSNEK